MDGSVAGFVALSAGALLASWWRRADRSSSSEKDEKCVSAISCGGKLHTLRLKPGASLTDVLAQYAKRHSIKACAVVTCVGSLESATIRGANACKESVSRDPSNDIFKLKQRMEILSLVGTLSTHGKHLHISLGDAQGDVAGGHLVGDAIVFTTAEIVLQEMDGVSYTRLFDSATGFKELAPSCC